MMLFYIKANVTIRVQGISGPWLKTLSYLVNAPNRDVAREKFETRVKQNNANMAFETIQFEYMEVAEEIL